MIGKLKGNIDFICEDHFIIDVAGVGYQVFASKRTLMSLEIGQFYEVLIETYVREDHIHLYGFSNAEEKNAFNILRSVKGVGTRMALSILSQMAPEEIQLALDREDKISFHNISGVGKKLAERIITELKDKLISTNISQFINSKSTAGAKINSKIENNVSNDAIIALTNLGLSQFEARSRVSNILAENSDMNISDLIRLALKNKS
ncbi:MAG: Holliday junction branch migration protein RuvA [Rickettsiaceae bacterium]|nr:Holliday junction branch migration protein RuvA [Rickettsiaceae bacterium]